MLLTEIGKDLWVSGQKSFGEEFENSTAAQRYQIPLPSAKL